MDVKELMIGDIVYNNTLGCFQCIVMDDYKAIIDGEEFEDEFEPIPLTAEILELNRWEKQYCDYALQLHNDSLVITLGNSYSQFGYSHLCGVGTDCIEVEYCSEIDFVGTLYVHQLQHALRLCGLTELADNFKVK